MPAERFEYLRQNKEDHFDVIPLCEIGRIIQDELVLVENPTLRGQYTLYYKKDLAAYKQLEAM